jgi:hypothetical protein
VAASPSKINTMAPGLGDNITTIAKTAITKVSATARAIGSPFAASGAAINIAHSSRISKRVSIGSLIRSRHTPTTLRLSPSAGGKPTAWCGNGLFATLTADL